MNRKEFKKLTEEYIAAENNYLDHLDEYFGFYWEGDRAEKDTKPITKEVIREGKRKRERFDKLRNKWRKELVSLK